MASNEEVISCESCGEVEGYLLDPKCLLRQHVICMTCLNDQKTEKSGIECLICRYITIRFVMIWVATYFKKFERIQMFNPRRTEPYPIITF